jgi:DNA-binding transcriptional ArsR family regulator
MDINKALVAFYALSQETRLQVFKILVEYGSTGVAAGIVSDRLKIPHNTLSFHLSNLSQAGLVSSRKNGRSVIYSANTKAIEGLIGYLSENCCVLESKENSKCCPPNKVTKRKRT